MKCYDRLHSEFAFPALVDRTSARIAKITPPTPAGVEADYSSWGRLIAEFGGYLFE